MNSINDESIVKKQYATANNLNTRISIHDKYSTNKQGFGKWIFSNYKFKAGMKVLELGCGNGDLWKGREGEIEDLDKLVLSDFSEGMLAAARENVGEYHNVCYKVINIMDIPYEDESFDVVIANMMLYHVPDINKGLSEVRRVLKKDGVFYTATYGEHGIMEYLSKVLASYGVKDTLNKTFTLQNGGSILKEQFPGVRRLDYADSLAVTNVSDMVDYIYSMSSMTALANVPKEEIRAVLEKNMEGGILSIPKEYGMFTADLKNIDRLEGEHIVLRKAREDDYASMLKNVWGDEEVYRWMLFKPTFTKEEAIERCKRSIEFQKDHLAYFVALKETDEAIGLCGIKELSPGHFDESGIGIGTKYHGKGYGKEIVELLLKLVFIEFGAEDCMYGYYQDNVKSKKVAEHFGFKYHHTVEMTRPWDGAKKVIDECLLTRQEYMERLEKKNA